MGRRRRHYTATYMVVGADADRECCRERLVAVLRGLALAPAVP